MPSPTRFAAKALPTGATVRDVLEFWQIPEKEVFLVLRNGQDLSPGLVGAPARLDVVPDHGDVIAFPAPPPTASATARRWSEPSGCSAPSEALAKGICMKPLVGAVP